MQYDTCSPRNPHEIFPICFDQAVFLVAPCISLPRTWSVVGALLIFSLLDIKKYCTVQYSEIH